MYLDFLSQYQPANEHRYINYIDLIDQYEEIQVLVKQQNILDIELDEEKFDELTPEKVMSLEFMEDLLF